MGHNPLSLSLYKSRLGYLYIFLAFLGCAWGDLCFLRSGEIVRNPPSGQSTEKSLALWDPFSTCKCTTGGALFFCELHPMNIDINSPNHSVVNNFPHANLHVWVPSRSVSSYRLHQNDRIWSNMDGFEQCGVHPSHPTLDSLRVETSVFRVSPLWVCLKMGLPRSPQNLIVCHHISSVEGVINEVYIYIFRGHTQIQILIGEILWNPTSSWLNHHDTPH